MNTTSSKTSKPIVPSFVVQEEGTRRVLVYLNLPELKVKRSFPNIFKIVPSNGHVKEMNFQTQSFTFTIHVQNKIYSLCIARLHDEIEPERCSLQYKRGGCWLTLMKKEPISWMNQICDHFNPGLNVHEDGETIEPETSFPSAPVREIPLKDTDMPLPYRLVPIAPSPRARSSTKKAPAPPPPYPRR